MTPRQAERLRRPARRARLATETRRIEEEVDRLSRALFPLDSEHLTRSEWETLNRVKVMLGLAWTSLNSLKVSLGSLQESADATPKRSVTVCDPVKGVVSPADVRAWLLATGWERREGVRLFGRGDNTLRGPRNDSTPNELERLIADLGYQIKRGAGDVLRAIMAHARGERAVDALPPSGEQAAKREQKSEAKPVKSRRRRR